MDERFYEDNGVVKSLEDRMLRTKGWKFVSVTYPVI
jgi:hypothetical protein